MPTFTVTKEAAAAIRSRAEYPFDDSTSVARKDGRVDIQLSYDTALRLREQRLGSESCSDTILRLCATAGKGVN